MAFSSVPKPFIALRSTSASCRGLKDGKGFTVGVPWKCYTVHDISGYHNGITLTLQALWNMTSCSCLDTRQYIRGTCLLPPFARYVIGSKSFWPDQLFNPFWSYIGPGPTLWFSCFRRFSWSLPFPIQFFCHLHTSQLLFILGRKEVSGLLVIILQF
jgi:hypothetical protein